MGPSELASDYFVPRADTIGSPQHNLFTARDRVLAALISLAGIIAVMTGFAGSTDSHVKTSAFLIGGFENSAKLMSVRQ